MHSAQPDDFPHLAVTGSSKTWPPEFQRFQGTRLLPMRSTLHPVEASRGHPQTSRIHLCYLGYRPPDRSWISLRTSSLDSLTSQGSEPLFPGAEPWIPGSGPPVRPGSALCPRVSIGECSRRCRVAPPLRDFPRLAHQGPSADCCNSAGPSTPGRDARLRTRARGGAGRGGAGRGGVGWGGSGWGGAGRVEREGWGLVGQTVRGDGRGQGRAGSGGVGQGGVGQGGAGRSRGGSGSVKVYPGVLAPSPRKTLQGVGPESSPSPRPGPVVILRPLGSPRDLPSRLVVAPWQP